MNKMHEYLKATSDMILLYGSKNCKTSVELLHVLEINDHPHQYYEIGKDATMADVSADLHRKVVDVPIIVHANREITRAEMVQVVKERRNDNK